MDFDLSDTEILEDASYTVKRDSRVAVSVAKLVSLPFISAMQRS